MAFEEFATICDDPSSSAINTSEVSRGFWTRPEHLPVQDELTRYLEVPDCPVTIEPAAWFKSHSEFRHIFKLYRKWCATPAAATSVERLWSQATFLDDRLRARMSPDLLATRLFIQKNHRVVALLGAESNLFE